MKQAADWMIQKRRGKCVCVHGRSVHTITQHLKPYKNRSRNFSQAYQTVRTFQMTS